MKAESTTHEPESLDIMYLLERLEEVLGGGTRLPFMSRALVDDEECFEIIDQIRLSLPNEIRQARKVNADRDAVIDQAQTRAEQILEGAESEARERVRDHHIAQEAEAQADEIIAQAERRAEQVRHDVDEYAYSVLLDLDKRLEGLVGTVRNGLRSLQPGETAPGEPDYPEPGELPRAVTHGATVTLVHNVSELLKSPVGTARQIAIDEPGPRFARDLHLVQPIRGTGRLLRTQNGVLVSAHLATTVELECSRCLEPVARDVEVELIEEFRPSINMTTGAVLEPPEDDALRIDERHLLDTTKAARQYVETAIPLQPLCQEACQGLCPQCGANLNQGGCTCGIEAPGSSNPFSALAALIDEAPGREPCAG